jgi:hypothetical protein
MSNDNFIAFQPSESPALFNDALTELVRKGARQIIAQAVEAELTEFLTQYQSLKDSQGTSSDRSQQIPTRAHDCDRGWGSGNSSAEGA